MYAASVVCVCSLRCYSYRQFVQKGEKEKCLFYIFFVFIDAFYWCHSSCDSDTVPRTLDQTGKTIPERAIGVQNMRILINPEQIRPHCSKLLKARRGCPSSDDDVAARLENRVDATCGLRWNLRARRQVRSSSSNACWFALVAKQIAALFPSRGHLRAATPA